MGSVTAVIFSVLIIMIILFFIFSSWEDYKYKKLINEARRKVLENNEMEECQKVNKAVIQSIELNKLKNRKNKFQGDTFPKIYKPE